MKFGKRRKDADEPQAADARAAVADSAAPPVTDSWTAPGEGGAPLRQHAEPVFEGEAVELPPAGPAAAFGESPAPLTRLDPLPFPVAEEPVAVAGSAARPGSGGAPVTSLGATGEAFASGHATAPGPSWQEPLTELAGERPELVVGAAFAGGVLAAMILRRIGN